MVGDDERRDRGMSVQLVGPAMSWPGFVSSPLPVAFVAR
jgi:hypothetical protein